MLSVFLMLSFTLSSEMGHAAPARSSQNTESPTILVHFDQISQEAIVAESSGVVVNFTGQIKIDRLSEKFSIAYMNATVDVGWPALCNPSEIILEPNTSSYCFTVKVSVPEATRAYPPGNLELTVNSNGPSYNVSATGRAVVSVGPYYKLFIEESKEGFKEVPPNTAVTFTLHIWNKGNANDSIELSVLNDNGLLNRGWSVKFERDKLYNVSPFESRDVNITVFPPSDWTLWKQSGEVIIINVTSLNAKNEGIIFDYVYPLVIYQKGTDSRSVGILVTVVILMVIVIAISIQKRRRTRSNKNNPRN